MVTDFSRRKETHFSRVHMIWCFVLCWWLGHGICDVSCKSSRLPVATDSVNVIAAECRSLLQKFALDPSDLRGVRPSWLMTWIAFCITLMLLLIRTELLIAVCLINSRQVKATVYPLGRGETCVYTCCTQNQFYFSKPDGGNCSINVCSCISLFKLHDER